jgi:hypothetical protein
VKLLAAAIVFAIFPAVKAAPPLNVDRLIEAICQVEDGQWGKPGGRGNIQYSAWSDVSDLPFYSSATESLALPVYRKHLDKLSGQLRSAGVNVNAQTLGTCWRWGFEGARRRHWKSDDGARTQNLYDDRNWWRDKMTT